MALLPKRERAAFDLVTTLLAKVPDSVRETSDMTFSERLQCEQTEHELLHDGEAKWTFDTLKALIARRVCARGAPTVSVAVSVAVGARVMVIVRPVTLATGSKDSMLKKGSR